VMNSYRALVIDDDPEIIEIVADTLASLGHAFDPAASQEEAQSFLRAHSYSYVLLDLEIPARVRGGIPRIQNGENLLQQIRQEHDRQELPVIVITCHGTQSPDLAVEMMKKGATDYVTKPFPSSGAHTLDNAILGAIGGSPSIRPSGGVAQRAEDEKRCRFRGGRMGFHPNRVELCGVKILGDTGMGYSRQMLELLAAKGEDGRFVTMTGRQIAEQIGSYVGDSNIIGCASTIRKNIKHRLREHLDMEVQPEDVLVNDDQGYHLKEWIVVERRDIGRDPAVTPQSVPALSPLDPDHVPDLNQRQRWVLDQLRQNVELTRSMIEEHFHVSTKTAKRDLAELRERGLIEYVRNPWPGHYALRGAP